MLIWSLKSETRINQSQGEPRAGGAAVGQFELAGRVEEWKSRSGREEKVRSSNLEGGGGSISSLAQLHDIKIDRASLDVAQVSLLQVEPILLLLSTEPAAFLWIQVKPNRDGLSGFAGGLLCLLV